jgi:hypothetical protein
MNIEFRIQNAEYSELELQTSDLLLPNSFIIYIKTIESIQDFIKKAILPGI